jgi:hypothetical protein
MRQIEPDPTAVNQLMMGPDGAVHVLPAASRKASPLPGEMERRPAATHQASAFIREDLPASIAKHDTELPGVRRVPEGGICFSYSADTPVTDRDAARQCLRGMRRMPGEGPICFSYSAGAPTTDRDAAQRALRDIRRMPQGGICFRY